MGEVWGIALRWVCAAMVVCSAWSWTGPASAQKTADDAAAREHFERGRAAFQRANYEQALVQFRHAYRLSRRGPLQYNIGVAADRLRRDEEAVEAFEHYLEEAENPRREQEVRERIAALTRTIEQRKETERALAEAARTDQAAAPVEESYGRKVPKSAIIGASVLAAVGVAGTVTMGVGLARSGACLEEMNGMCQTERATSPWTPVYGAVGIAALVGSATWLGVSSKRTKEKRNTAWMLTPTGVVVSGSF